MEATSHKGKENIMGKYDDIINMEHHVSNKHPHMSIHDRAAQFAPFAAITEHRDVVKEKARLTDKRIEIDEELKKELDRKLQILQKNIDEKYKISFIYFIPDLKKEGGRYITVTGIIKRIDEYEDIIVLEDKTKIPIKEIIDINSEEIKFEI